MKRIFQCIMIIIGTLIGAGYASGQEIKIFFNQFLENGMMGIVLSSILFGVVTFLILSILHKSSMLDYQKLVNHNRVVIPLMKAFTFICFCIMLSGVGTYVYEQWNISFWMGTIGAGVICFIAFLFQFHGLEKINIFLVPLILLGMGFLYVCTDVSSEAVIALEGMKMKSPFLNNWIQAAILYVGYNSIILIPILLEMKTYHFRRKEIFVLSLMIAFILCLTGLMIYTMIHRHYAEVWEAEMPTLLLAKSGGSILFLGYSIIILFAIFTTAFSSGYAFLKLNQEESYLKNSIFICVLGVVVARVGFSHLVNFFFPLFGYLGIVQMVMIVYQNRKNILK